MELQHLLKDFVSSTACWAVDAFAMMFLEDEDDVIDGKGDGQQRDDESSY
jgi:hypothetical protein